MAMTRREFNKLALSAVPAAAVLPAADLVTPFTQSKPNSLFRGVQVGVITYSYRSMPDQSAEATLKYVVDSGVSAIELMDGPAETFAGRPAGGRGGGGGGRGEAQAALKAWRLSVSMDRYKELRKMYNDAGVSIYAVKILNPTMSDEEYEYVFNVAEALGCTHTTLELPADEIQLRRIGEFALKRKIYAAYHTHTQGSMIAFDKAFELSKGNMANVDLGHYVAGGNVGGTTLEFLERHHARISSVHLKDRQSKEKGGANVFWGEGDTPIREILQLMAQRKWRFPATVEMEYRIPAGSDAVAETRKCVQYCAAALA